MYAMRTFFVIAALAACVVISAAAVNPVKPADRKFTNLTVLPRDISPENLNRIMVDEFTDGLGVSCSYCHVAGNDGLKPDYASDANPEKERARAMMRMTLQVNKKFLKVKHPMLGDPSMVVTCNTCHHGQAFPE